MRHVLHDQHVWPVSRIWCAEKSRAEKSRSSYQSHCGDKPTERRKSRSRWVKARYDDLRSTFHQTQLDATSTILPARTARFYPRRCASFPKSDDNPSRDCVEERCVILLVDFIRLTGRRSFRGRCRGQESMLLSYGYSERRVGTVYIVERRWGIALGLPH